MFTIDNFLSQEIVQKIGWTLLHFIWQATVFALVLAVLQRLLRRFSANLRYIVACMALLAVVALPFITMQFINVSSPSPPPAIIPVTDAMTVQVEPVGETPTGRQIEMNNYIQAEPIIAKSGVVWKQQVINFIEPKLPYIVTLWLLGVFALSVWHLGGWAQLQKLRKKMVKQVDTSLYEKLNILAKKLGVNQAVELLESALVQIPTVVGWIRPVILLPASAMTGLTAEQLEAILAHELAHIKRYDYLVNILQTIVEILGFYHPAVWWISHKIRAERENCCDDIAVAVCGDRINYAKALTSMEEIRGKNELAVAATGGNLFSRIRRLIGKDSNEKTFSWIPSTAVILLLVALIIPTTLALTSTRIENDSDLDAETILEKVRQAQRPFDNMQIEWLEEHDGLSGAVFTGAATELEDLPIQTKYKWSAVLSGNRSRIEKLQETYYVRDPNEPGNIRHTISVFDGNERRQLEKIIKGSRPGRTSGVIWLSEGNSYLLRQTLFGTIGNEPPIYDKERLEEYKLTLKDRDKPNLIILDTLDSYKWTRRYTIDKNRGYNIIKYECFRQDGSKDYEDNIKLKQYPNGIWFISERERIRYNLLDKTTKTIETRITVTDIKFGENIPNDIFHLQFPEGSTFADLTFNYNSHTNFLIGCLSEPKHTQETSAVTAILNKPGNEDIQENSKEIFGMVIERTINGIEQRKDCFIDLDTGTLFDIPVDFHFNNKQEEWFEENSIEARVETNKNLCGLWTLNTVVIPVSNERWDTISPEACHEALRETKGIYPPIMSAEGKLPETFLFQTLDNKGILQILEAKREGDQRSIKIRYKIIQEKQNNQTGQSEIVFKIVDSKANEFIRINFDLNDLEPGQYVEIEDTGQKEFRLSQVPTSSIGKGGGDFPGYASYIDFKIRSNFDLNLATQRITRGELFEHDKWDAYFTGPNKIIGDGNFSTTTLCISTWNPDLTKFRNLVADAIFSLVTVTIKPDNKQASSAEVFKIVSSNIEFVRVFFDLNDLEPGQYVEIEDAGQKEFPLTQVTTSSIGKDGGAFPAYASYIDFKIRSNFDLNLATQRITRGELFEHDKWDAYFTGPNKIIGDGNFSTITLCISTWNPDATKLRLWTEADEDTIANLVAVTITPED